MQHTIPVRFTDELLSEIDEVCRQMAASGITRSQAIRQLLMEAIVSRKRAKK
jgi:metal-responsive CopG/Arc/MetJ family transcriptional regulator